MEFNLTSVHAQHKQTYPLESSCISFKKYIINMQLGTPEIISKSQRERLIMPNIGFMREVRLSGTAF